MALSCSGYGGNEDCIESVLEIPGFDWNIQDDLGQTPVMVAIEMTKSREALEKIMNVPQIDWRLKDNEGMTAVMRTLIWSNQAKKLKCLKIMAKVPGIDWNDPAHIVIPDKDSVPMDPQFMAAMDEDSA